MQTSQIAKNQEFLDYQHFPCMAAIIEILCKNAEFYGENSFN